MSTTFAKQKEIDRRWLIIDADGKVLGRLATKIAHLLRGKHKVYFTPFLDTGDFVVIVNARKIKVTGQKMSQKTYTTYSGYPDGLKTHALKDLIEKQPEKVIQNAVKGMLPHGPLGRKMLGKLKVYPGAEHPHSAQKPVPVS